MKHKCIFHPCRLAQPFFCHSNFISSAVWTAGSAVTGVWSDSWDLLTVLYANGPAPGQPSGLADSLVMQIWLIESILQKNTRRPETLAAIFHWLNSRRKKKKLNAKHFDAYSYQPLKCSSVYFGMFSTLCLNVVNAISCAIAEFKEGLVFFGFGWFFGFF